MTSCLIDPCSAAAQHTVVDACIVLSSDVVLETAALTGGSIVHVSVSAHGRRHPDAVARIGLDSDVSASAWPHRYCLVLSSVSKSLTRSCLCNPATPAPFERILVMVDCW